MTMAPHSSTSYSLFLKIVFNTPNFLMLGDPWLAASEWAACVCVCVCVCVLNK